MSISLRAYLLAPLTALSSWPKRAPPRSEALRPLWTSFDASRSWWRPISRWKEQILARILQTCPSGQVFGGGISLFWRHVCSEYKSWYSLWRSRAAYFLYTLPLQSAADKWRHTADLVVSSSEWWLSANVFLAPYRSLPATLCSKCLREDISVR